MCDRAPTATILFILEILCKKISPGLENVLLEMRAT